MWNSIKNKDNIKWANAIKDKELYKQNADGSLEYTYILNSTDSTDIATLRNIGFNYIGYYFNVIMQRERIWLQTVQVTGLFSKGN